MNEVDAPQPSHRAPTEAPPAGFHPPIRGTSRGLGALPPKIFFSTELFEWVIFIIPAQLWFIAIFVH